MVMTRGGGTTAGATARMGMMGRFMGRPRAKPGDEARRGPRTGAKRTVLHYIRQLPHYVRLLGGLITDRRVSIVDKLLVAGAIAYIVMPLDLIPDFIPFLGEVDDVYLLLIALQRLVANAGRSVLLDHWHGDPADLGDMNLRAAMTASAFFLPKSIRAKLHRSAK